MAHGLAFLLSCTTCSPHLNYLVKKGLQPETDWGRIAYALVCSDIKDERGKAMKFDRTSLTHVCDLFAKLFVCMEDELLRRDNYKLPKSFSTLITVFDHWAGRNHSNFQNYGPAWAFALLESVGQPRKATLREFHDACSQASEHLRGTNRRSKHSDTGDKPRTSSAPPKMTTSKSHQPYSATKRTPATSPCFYSFLNIFVHLGSSF